MHKKITTSVLCAILCAVLIFNVFTFGGFMNDSKELQFNNDGKFTILNFSDIQDSYPLMGITKDLIKNTLKTVKPDLIILTGDNIAGYSAHTKLVAKAAIDEYMDIFEGRGIPVAQVFGNHDDQDTTATKEYQMDCYESYKCFVGKRGDELTGLGTYNLPILSSDGSHYAFNLWFTDSGTYNNENDLGGYGCVGKDQIEWYLKTAKELKINNGGKNVPAMNFQHIVVPEIYDALDKNPDGSYKLPNGSVGELNENPCPPKYSNGQFDAFLKQGDVIATVNGHDHVNNYVVPYKGIDIINTPGVGFRSYNGDVVGSRVIIIDENEPENYETYCLSYSDIYGSDEAAKLRYNMFSDTTSGLTKVSSFFKYIYVKVSYYF